MALMAGEPGGGVPAPVEVRARFADVEEREGAEAAVRYLYDLERACGYLKEEAVARNICWTAPSPCGPLEVTVNCAKPEKDPRVIAAAYEAAGLGADASAAADASGSGPSLGDAPGDAAGAAVELTAGRGGTDASGVARAAADGAAPRPREPRCDLCWENEGWPGSPAHPAKPGLRIVPVTLGGERWGLQFSPYAYFPEHCIVLSAEHRPMKVDGAAVGRLLDFADQFPFYFIGSNAGLPVVGGSILCHDHFQGGRHEFPLMRAAVEQELALEGLPGVRAGIVRWPASVLRVASPDRGAVLAAAERVMGAWERFGDEAAGILARTDAPHNAVSPILRKLPAGRGWAAAGFAGAGSGVAAVTEPADVRGAGLGDARGAGAASAAAGSSGAGDGEPALYVLDLVLRNNRTTAERPFGLFHPDESLFHIKRENIGLIEVMGRAILPGRLACELPAVQRTLWTAAQAEESPADLQERLADDPLTAPHAPWAADVLARRRADLTAEAAGALGVGGGAGASSAPGARAADALELGFGAADASGAAVAASALEAEAAGADAAAPAALPLAPVMRDEVTQVFYRVLQATAVFKPDAVGRRAQARFLDALGARLTPR